jgi:hypothetical protein
MELLQVATIFSMYGVELAAREPSIAGGPIPDEPSNKEE